MLQDTAIVKKRSYSILLLHSAYKHQINCTDVKATWPLSAVLIATDKSGRCSPIMHVSEHLQVHNTSFFTRCYSCGAFIYDSVTALVNRLQYGNACACTEMLTCITTVTVF